MTSVRPKESKAKNLQQLLKQSTAEPKLRLKTFLTKISYRRYKPKDFQNNAFVIDVYSFLLQNVNPLMTDRKFDSENDRNYIKMLRQKCLLHVVFIQKTTTYS